MRRLVKVQEYALALAALALVAWLGTVAIEAARLIRAGDPLHWSVAARFPVDWNDLAIFPIMAAFLAADLLANGPERRRDLLDGLRYDLFFVVADGIGASAALAILFSLGFSAWFQSVLGLAPVWHGVGQLPLLIQIPFIYLLGTFGDYWGHRMMHGKLMWPLHALHHASSNMTALSDSRGHPLDNFFKGVPPIVIFAFLGFSAEAVLLAMTVGRLQAALNHSRLGFPLWIQRWMFSGPQLHRVHHGLLPEHHDVNFSQFVPWDRIFGTFYLPDDAASAPTGVADPRYDSGRPFNDLWTVTELWLAGLRIGLGRLADRLSRTTRERRLPRNAAAVLAGSLLIAAVPQAGAAPAAARLTAEGEAFVLVTADGRRLTTRDLVGATIDMDDADGRSFSLRIDRATPAKERSSLMLLDVSIRDPGTGEWTPFCSPDHFGRRAAFPVTGAWDQAGHFAADKSKWFVTCTSGSQGKCILFGYDPWSRGPHGEDLVPYYEACQHLVRADYDGSGISYTRDGTMIDVWDRLGIQTDDSSIEAMKFEAGWSPAGAVCVARTRIPDKLMLQELVEASDRLSGPCDEQIAAAKGALLFNRSR